jgi:hypothetical protein
MNSTAPSLIAQTEKGRRRNYLSVAALLAAGRVGVCQDRLRTHVTEIKSLNAACTPGLFFLVCSLCDCFDIPILLLCDCPGFMVGIESEAQASLRHMVSEIHPIKLSADRCSPDKTIS